MDTEDHNRLYSYEQAFQIDKEDHSRSPNKKIDKNRHLDRKSSSGLRLDPKKRGYGGWGVEGYTDSLAVDPNDPNYNSDEERKAIQSISDNSDATQSDQNVIKSSDFGPWIKNTRLEEYPVELPQICIPRQGILVVLPSADGVQGQGWDCVYRCLQSIAFAVNPEKPLPTIWELTEWFIGQGYIKKFKDWLEPMLVYKYLVQHEYIKETSTNLLLSLAEPGTEVSCRINTVAMYKPDQSQQMTYNELQEALVDHFLTYVTPVAIDDGLHGVLVYGIRAYEDDAVLIGDGQCVYQSKPMMYRALKEAFPNTKRLAVLFPEPM